MCGANCSATNKVAQSSEAMLMTKSYTSFLMACIMFMGVVRNSRGFLSSAHLLRHLRHSSSLQSRTLSSSRRSTDSPTMMQHSLLSCQLTSAKGTPLLVSGTRSSLRLSSTSSFDAATDTDTTSQRVDYFSIQSNSQLEYGEYKTIVASIDPSKLSRAFVDVQAIDKSIISADKPTYVWVRGRVNSVRAKGNACFLVLRSKAFNTIQCVHFKDKESPDQSKALIKYVGNEIPLESIVDIYGVVVPADVKSCSQNDVEIQIKKVFLVSKAPVVLPFSLDDAGRSQEEIEKSQATEKPFANIPQVRFTSSCQE
jgi:lysyl-tRNA synthetase class II